MLEWRARGVFGNSLWYNKAWCAFSLNRILTSLMNQNTRDPDEVCEVRCLLDQVIEMPDLWLDTPNDQFGGRKPRDLLNTPQESRIRDLLRSIKHGMAT
jgi:hypothetical protein